MPSKPDFTPNPSSSPPKSSPISNCSSTSTTNITTPPPPKPVPSSTTSSAPSGSTAAPLPPKNPANPEPTTTRSTHLPTPASPEARALLDDLIRCEWLQRRLHTAETQFWAFDNKDAWTPDNQYPLGQTVSRRSKAFGQLQWRINCTRRAVPGQCAAGGQFGESTNRQSGSPNPGAFMGSDPNGIAEHVELALERTAPKARKQIGRASCRERV